MASLSSLMRRHLAVVDDDGDGEMGNNDYDDFDDAMDFAASRWRCCPHRDGVVAVADAQASCHCQR